MDEKQKPLFGKADLIINTLSTERSEVADEMIKLKDSIEKKEEKLGELEARRENLDKSIEEARKISQKKVKKEPEPF